MKIIPYGTTTNEEISKLETELNTPIPQDYKNFLLNHNGGTPEIRYAEFYVEDLDESIYLQVLYGIGIKDLDISEWSNMWPSDLLPHSIIIGHIMGNGFILLVNDGENNGIYYYDHAYTFPQSSDEENTYFIASTFTEFIDSLKEASEDED